jgi:predicted nucleotidyltransferase
MRLTSGQIKLIHDCLQKYFGQNSRIWLFGSRLNDNAKGRDIDLYLEPVLQEPDALVEARLNALKELHQKLGDQKIDLVIRREKSAWHEINRVSREQGVRI